MKVAFTHLKERNSPKATYEIPYATVSERPAPPVTNTPPSKPHFEVPALQWATFPTTSHDFSLNQRLQIGNEAKGQRARSLDSALTEWPDAHADQGDQISLLHHPQPTDHEREAQPSVTRPTN